MLSQKHSRLGFTLTIIFAVCMGTCIVSLHMFAGGIFFVHLLEKYDEGEVKTNLVGTLNVSLNCLLAPLASLFMNRYSCRVSIVFGTLLISTGTFLSAWATNITMMILTFGVLSGIGNPFTTIPFAVVLGYYVKRHRHFVISASSAFSGLGLYLSTPLTLHFIDQYGIKGAYILMSGLTLQMCVIGMLCKPSNTELKLIQQHLGKGQVKELQISSVNETTKSCAANSDYNKQFNMDTINKQRQCNINTQNEVREWNISYKNSQRVSKYNAMEIPKECTIAAIYNPQDDSIGTENEPTYCKTVSIENPRACTIVTCTETKDKLHHTSTFGVQSLSNPVFILFVCSTCAWHIILGTVVLHLPNYMQVTGKTVEEVTLTMACFTISNFIGRLVSMLISLKEDINGLIIYWSAMFVGGFVSAGFQWYSHVTFANDFFAAMIGFLTGSPNGMMAPVALKIAGLGYLPTALSILLFFAGIALFVGPVIASALLEGFGSYSSTFVFTGCVSFAGSMCSLCAWLLMRTRNEMRQ